MAFLKKMDTKLRKIFHKRFIKILQTLCVTILLRFRQYKQFIKFSLKLYRILTLRKYFNSVRGLLVKIKT